MTAQPEIISVVVTVRALKPAILPAHLGRAIQSVFYRWIDSVDSSLSSQWHDADGPKPYACSALVGGRRECAATRAVTPDLPCWFRLCGLSEAVTSALIEVTKAVPESVEIDGSVFQVESVTTDHAIHPWAGTARYDALAAPHLLAGSRADKRLDMEFLTPVTFKSRERTMPIPLPELVFGSLMDRWNAFSSVSVSNGVREFCEQSVGINRFELRSAGVPMTEGGLQIGAVGTVGYTALRYDRYWLAVLNLLAQYAFFAGVGKGVTTGMGQTQPIRTDTTRHTARRRDR
jgi:CRISPR-associated endoribonuclease Cas6